jgi:hypothetical protein
MATTTIEMADSGPSRGGGYCGNSCVSSSITYRGEGTTVRSDLNNIYFDVKIFMPMRQRCSRAAATGGILAVDSATTMAFSPRAAGVGCWGLSIAIGGASLSSSGWQVKPGTEFEIQQTPVDDEVWLPRRLSIRSTSSILFFFQHHVFEEHTYFGYRRATASTNPSSSGDCN